MAATNAESSRLLTLSEDEAYALLTMCMLSPMKLDPEAESALRKLAAFCRSGHLYIYKSDDAFTDS